MQRQEVTENESSLPTYPLTVTVEPLREQFLGTHDKNSSGTASQPFG